MKPNYQKDYDEFWRDLVETNGVIDQDKVARELSDYRVMIGNLSKLYCYISGNVISKPMVSADAVLQLFEEQLKEQYEQGYSDCQDDIKKMELDRDVVNDDGCTHVAYLVAPTPIKREPILRLTRRCPKCKSEDVLTERRPDGDTFCCHCKYKNNTKYFDTYELKESDNE